MRHSTSDEYGELLGELRARRKELNLTLDALAAATGTSAIFIGTVLAGQAQLRPEAAEKLAGALSIDVQSLEPLMEPPLRPSDPFIYRMHEMVEVYGDALREWTLETFGDGILSAIDLKIAIERKGERAVITLDSKFLPYKEF